MHSSNNISNISNASFSSQPTEQFFKQIYQNEFNELFQYILQYPSGKFISQLFKLAKLTISHKFNGRLPQYIPKIEKQIIEQYYPSQYNIANTVVKQIKTNPNNELNTFNSSTHFIKHCKQTQKAIHTCGNKLIISKISNSIFLYCIKCNLIYKDNFIRLKCTHCNNCEYYSRLLTPNEINNKQTLYYATWEKYHCNAVINDVMKCIKCKSNFYYDIHNEMLICTKCNYTIEPYKIEWKCVICGNNFMSNAKAYNELEFKYMKICVKEALVNKIKALPKENDFNCGCVGDINTYVFYHKNGCSGTMLLGEMNGRKIVVCSLCRALSYLENFVWMCPICGGNKNMKGNSCTPVKDRNCGVNRKYNSAQKEEGVVKRRKISMGELMKYSRNLHNNSNKNGFNLQLSQVHNGENKENISVNTLVIKQVTQQKQEKPRRKRHSAGNIHQLQLQNFNNNYLITNYNNNNNNKSNNNNNVMKPQYTQVVPQMQTTPLPIIDADTYDIKTKIGEGSFGKIYLVEKNNTKYALKKIVATTPHEISNLRHEYEILSYLSTNLKINIITIHGTQSKHLDRTTYVLYILMELAETDWEKEISTRSKTASYYTESELIFILKSLTKTFSLLQKESISHRDIKPQNILICPHNIFKVADFGEAKELLKNKSNTDNQTIRGTELFMSPILFKAVRNRKCIIVKHNSYKSDVFSLGLCILYAATLTVNSIYDLRELITNIEIENVVRRYINKRYSEKFIKVIMKMLNYNEKERCDFIEMENVINKEFM